MKWTERLWLDICFDKAEVYLLFFFLCALLLLLLQITDNKMPVDVASPYQFSVQLFKCTPDDRMTRVRSHQFFPICFLDSLFWQNFWFNFIIFIKKRRLSLGGDMWKFFVVDSFHNILNECYVRQYFRILTEKYYFNTSSEKLKWYMPQNDYQFLPKFSLFENNSTRYPVH